MELTKAQINQIVGTAQEHGQNSNDAVGAGCLAKITGDWMAAIKFLDWQADPDLYFARVQSGYYAD